jgi:hypothetical protein
MAGPEHQFILGLIIRQARMAGFTIFFAEGKYISESSITVETLSPKVLRHRPDAVGVALTGQVCIIDAKTLSDLHSKRTAEQIEDFTNVELNGLPCEVFLGIPADAEAILLTLLEKLALKDNPRIHILRVPRELMNAQG